MTEPSVPAVLRSVLDRRAFHARLLSVLRRPSVIRNRAAASRMRHYLFAQPTSPVPRTRSSHYNCRESDCELRVQSGTRIIELLVSFNSEVRSGANFGIEGH